MFCTVVSFSNLFLPIDEISLSLSLSLDSILSWFIPSKDRKRRGIITGDFVPSSFPLLLEKSFSHLPRFSTIVNFAGEVTSALPYLAKFKEISDQICDLAPAQWRARPLAETPAIQIADSIHRGGHRESIYIIREATLLCHDFFHRVTNTRRVCPPPQLFEPAFEFVLSSSPPPEREKFFGTEGVFLPLKFLLFFSFFLKSLSYLIRNNNTITTNQKKLIIYVRASK